MFLRGAEKQGTKPIVPCLKVRICINRAGGLGLLPAIQSTTS